MNDHLRFLAAVGWGILIVSSVVTGSITVVDRPDPSAGNKHYAGNRPPLMNSPLIKLPVGSIDPKGWLRRQLELEADGFVGHLPEISAFCRKKGNAWLDPAGRGHSGWEEVPYWLRGFVALGYVLDDERIVTASRPWIEHIFTGQCENGYFGPRKNLGDGKHGPDLMPNMNMLFVLRHYYEYTGDTRALDTMRRYFKWELTIPDKKFFAGGWQVPRNGDNLATVYWLYNRTGEPFLLELAKKLQRTGASWLHTVDTCHNVDFSQGFRKPAQYYQQNRDPAFLAATEKNWKNIMKIYGQVPGGMFGGDEFARPHYTDPRQAIETCGVVEMMFSAEKLLRITGENAWADRCDDAAFNTLPATTTADLKALRYLTSPNQVNSDRRSKAPALADGGPMQVMNPHDHRCCQHNFGFGWPYYADSLWCAAPGNGLAAVFYAAAGVTATVGGGTAVTIDQETRYPFDETVALTLRPAAPVTFPLFLRVPGWCTTPAVSINGTPQRFEQRPGSYIRIEREWKRGDRLVLTLPMTLAVTVWEDNHNSVSVNFGPLTFSLKIGENYRRCGGTDTWPAWEILPATDWNYGLALDPAAPGSALRVERKTWPANDMPFTHDGAPIVIRAAARRIPAWQEDHHGLVDELQPGPVKSDSPPETVALIPMGAARLRIAAFPRIDNDDPDARRWQPPAAPLTSFNRGRGVDPYEAMFDGKVPEHSHDRGIPRFTTYSFGGAEHGKKHWVQRNFDRPRIVSSCAVYWYDETPQNGSVRRPRWWRVLYRDGDRWKPVTGAGDYGVELDRFNRVRFDPVKTESLRLVVQCRNRYAMGIMEWRISTENETSGVE